MIVPEYYENYTRYSGHGQYLQQLSDQLVSFPEFLSTVPEDKWDHRYEPGKWNIKEIVQHLIDTERIFCYRALRIARGDKTELSGFDHDAYVPASAASEREPDQLIADFTAMRRSTISMFSSFSPEMLSIKGTANNGTFDPEGIGCTIAGHLHHHSGIIKSRYLK